MQTGFTFYEDKQPLDTCEILAALPTQFHTKTHKTEKKLKKYQKNTKTKQNVMNKENTIKASCKPRFSVEINNI